MPNIILEDVSLRDGLQSEARLLSLEHKVAVFELLASAGFERVQVGSFVNPRVVPQMAGAESLIERISGRYPHVTLTALVLNEKGLDRAMRCRLDHLSVSVSASDTHSRKNARISADKALKGAARLISKADAAGVRVRAGIQCAFGCVDEGPVPEGRVVKAAETLSKAGASEINLGDTTGMAGPVEVKRLIRFAKESVPECALSLHLHDTRGLGLVNMLAGYHAGVRIFDVSAGGLGGCPFVQGAGGNIAAEDAAYLFERVGEKTGVHLHRLCRAVERYESLLGRNLPGHMTRVLNALDSPGARLESARVPRKPI